MLAWALTLVASASPEPPAERTVEAWVNLVPTAMGFTWTPARPGLGLGANVMLSKYVDVTFEAVVMGYPTDTFCASAGVIGWGALGTTLRPFANGFFVLPKLSFRVQWMEGLRNSERFDDNCTPIAFPNGLDWDVGGGLSVGFDFLVWKRLYLGLAAGAGAAGAQLKHARTRPLAAGVQGSATARLERARRSSVLNIAHQYRRRTQARLRADEHPC